MASLMDLVLGCSRENRGFARGVEDKCLAPARTAHRVSREKTRPHL